MPKVFDILSALGNTRSVGDEPVDVVSRIIKEKAPVSSPGITIEEGFGVERDISKSELQRQIGNILAEYDMLESNIPVTSRYWRLCNQYRNR